MRQKLLDPTVLVFLAIALLVVVWIGSGMIGRESATTPDRVTPDTPTVAASWSEAREISRELVLYGDVEPIQVSLLRARTDGIVEDVVSAGTRVQAGDVVAHLSSDDREARLARARAQVSSAQREYESTRELMREGLAPEAEVQTRLAQLEAARADLRSIQLEIANTELRAPINGVVNRVISDRGAYVTVGGEVLEVVDNDPLIAVVQVQQASISRIRAGMPAHVRFIGGEEKNGVVRFVSPIADASTRTFRVEIEISNEDRRLPSGLSAEVVLPYEMVEAHRVSAALVRLDAQGRIGVHVVDDEAHVRFVPIEIVRARADGIWVTGLPERARIVTINQGMLAPGQRVNVEETPPGYETQTAVGSPGSAVEQQLGDQEPDRRVEAAGSEEDR